MVTEDLSTLYHRCIQLLARREFSQKDLLERLQNEGYEKSRIVLCLEKLVANNYQSDERFAHMLCRTRINQRYGPRKIHYQLKQQGISDVIISEVLADQDERFFDNICYLINRHGAHIKSDSIANIYKTPTLRAKIERKLFGKGYDYDMIKRAFLSLNVV